MYVGKICRPMYMQFQVYKCVGVLHKPEEIDVLGLIPSSTKQLKEITLQTNFLIFFS